MATDYTNHRSSMGRAWTEAGTLRSWRDRAGVDSRQRGAEAGGLTWDCNGLKNTASLIGQTPPGLHIIQADDFTLSTLSPRRNPMEQPPMPSPFDTATYNLTQLGLSLGEIEALCDDARNSSEHFTYEVGDVSVGYARHGDIVEFFATMSDGSIMNCGWISL